MKTLWIVALCLYVGILQAQVECSLGGRLFLDGGAFIASPSHFNSGVCIPDLRLTGKAKWREGWSAKLDVGFASNKVVLKDAFIQKIQSECYLFRLGYTIGIFSLDQSSSTNDYLFMTGANVAETFYPDRRIGLSYTYFSPRYYVSGGVFCGDGLNFQKTIRQGWNTTLRAVYRPVMQEGRLLHVGIGGLYKRPDRNLETQEQTLVLHSKGVTYLPVPYVLEQSFKEVASQCQWNVEMIACLGRCFFQAEYMEMFVRHTKGMSYKARGGYVEGGMFLLGEGFSYDSMDAMQTCPDEPNSLAVFGRFNCTDLNDAMWRGGKQYDISLGVNYYLSRNVIFRINYSYLRTDKYAAVPDETWNVLQSRVQIKF